MPNRTFVMSSDRNARLTALFFLSLLVFNYPLVQIFGKNRFVLGVPVLYAYLFLVWLALILLIYRAVNKRN